MCNFEYRIQHIKIQKINYNNNLNKLMGPKQSQNIQASEDRRK